MFQKIQLDSNFFSVLLCFYFTSQSSMETFPQLICQSFSAAASWHGFEEEA